MAPKRKAREVSNVGSSQQTVDVQQIGNILARINQRTKERRRKQQEAIITEHKARVHENRGDLERCLNEHDKRLQLIRQPTRHLLELVQKRQRILNQISKCHASIRASCQSTGRSMDAALKGRIDDLST